MMKLSIKSISLGALMAASMSTSVFAFPSLLEAQGLVEYSINKRVPATSSNPIQVSDRAVMSDISREDLEEMKLFSRRVLQQLPKEEQIASLKIRNPSDRRLQVYARQGRRAIEKMARDGDRLTREEARNLYSQLQQAERSIIISGNPNPAATSCIGTAEGEKQDCIKNCKGSGKKFCGCYWNSFLAKVNCFFPSKN